MTLGSILRPTYLANQRAHTESGAALCSDFTNYYDNGDERCAFGHIEDLEESHNWKFGASVTTDELEAHAGTHFAAAKWAAR